jgi:hypothetical protein
MFIRMLIGGGPTPIGKLIFICPMVEGHFWRLVYNLFKGGTVALGTSGYPGHQQRLFAAIEQFPDIITGHQTRPAAI